MITYPNPVRTEAIRPGRDRRQRVLVVDDHLDITSLLARLLLQCGFEVETALDGRAATEKARSFHPDYILLDIGLPGMNGYEVAEMLHGDEAQKDTTIIAISAYGPEVHPLRSRQAKFDYHLVKPVDLEVLLSLLSPELN